MGSPPAPPPQKPAEISRGQRVPSAGTDQSPRHGRLVVLGEVLLQGQHDAVGNDGGQDHVLEGREGESRSRGEADGVPTTLLSPKSMHRAQLSPPGRREKPPSTLFAKKGGDEGTRSPQDLPWWRCAEPHRPLPRWGDN